jgi:hypothetical protein
MLLVITGDIDLKFARIDLDQMIEPILAPMSFGRLFLLKEGAILASLGILRGAPCDQERGG